MKQILRKVMTLVCLIALVAIPTSKSAVAKDSLTDNQITSNGHLESFSVAELDKHSDVKDYISSSRCNNLFVLLGGS